MEFDRAFEVGLGAKVTGVVEDVTGRPLRDLDTFLEKYRPHFELGDGSKRWRFEPAARRRGYPSRELGVAIRDYAPGAEVVLNGRPPRPA